MLFHHVQGLTPGVVAFADELRAAGHTVHTPYLFDGRTFDSIEAAMAHAREIGFGEIDERAKRIADGLPAELARCCSTPAFPPSEFGSSWPAGLPVQIHGMEADPFFAGEGDIDAARALVDEAQGAEPFVHPCDQHLFADSSLPSYDPDAAELLTLVLRCLEAFGPASGADVAQFAIREPGPGRRCRLSPVTSSAWRGRTARSCSTSPAHCARTRTRRHHPG